MIGKSMPDAAAALEEWSQELDLRSLAGDHGTPTYVLHAPSLRDNVAAYRDLVEEPGRILYPVKANPSLAVLRELARLGCGMDCASRDEVDLAQFAGVPAERISYNTPAPEFGLIRTLLRAGATVVVDSEALLERLAIRVPAAHVRGALQLRLNLDSDSEYLQCFDWERMVSHGDSRGRFGIPARRIPELLSALPLPVTGLHVHVGTMMDNLATFENAVGFLHELVERIHAQTPQRITALNLGGGLGIPFLPGQSFPSIAALSARLKPLFRPGIRYFIEPGQSLVGNTMGLLARVVSLKSMRGRRWAILDVGSDQLIKITTVSWHHRILDGSHRALPLEGPDAVGGPLCFAGDTLLPATRLDGIEAGDVLFLQHAGAYLEAIANRFNGRRSVGLIVLDDGGVRRATQAEDPFFSAPLQTYDWSESPEDPGAPEALTPAEIEALRSDYFARMTCQDHYSITHFLRTGENSFRFVVETSAGVDFISIPFAQRITADAVIIAVMRRLGRTVKDVSVWGTKGTYEYREPIRPGTPLEGTVTLSTGGPPSGDRKRLLTGASLDGGRFTMTAEIVV
jgi:diaminopimelate decarboxylase